MEQTLTKQELFVTGLKASLRTGGARVKKKDLIDFFIFLEDVCPWFPQEGAIDDERWQRVGECLKDCYHTFGPEKVPVQAFSYWNLINNILQVRHLRTDASKVVEDGESFLRTQFKGSQGSLSKPPNPSPCPSVSISMPPRDTEGDIKKPGSIFPVVSGMKASDPGDGMPAPEGEAQLTDEAANCAAWPPNVALPPHYANPPPFFAPALAAASTDDSFDLTRRAIFKLTREAQALKTLLQVKREKSDLLKQLRELDLEVSRSPGDLSKTKTGARSQVRSKSSSREEESPESSEREDSSDEEDGNNPLILQKPSYRRLKFKCVKELKSAVSLYGPTARFTLSLLESLSEDWLTIHDWEMLAKASLSRGQYLLWKADYTERCRDISDRNASAGGQSNLRKLLGQRPYNSNDKQAAFHPGLLAQIQLAARQAWNVLPSQGSAISSISKIRQGAQEPFGDFVRRLNEAAERFIGPAETDSELIRHLAFENANSACRAVLHPHGRNKTLTDYIRLCADVDPVSHNIGLAIGTALKDSTQRPKAGTCFNCKQPGHFQKGCSAPKVKRPTPPSLCPRCKRGKHWASECRSKTDNQGNPLPPKKGNLMRGPPQGPKPTMGSNPGAVRFVPQSPTLQV